MGCYIKTANDHQEAHIFGFWEAIVLAGFLLFCILIHCTYCKSLWIKASTRDALHALMMQRIISKRLKEGESKGACDLNSFGVLSFGVLVIDWVPEGPPEGQISIIGWGSGRDSRSHRSHHDPTRQHECLTLAHVQTLFFFLLPFNTWTHQWCTNCPHIHTAPRAHTQERLVDSFRGLLPVAKTEKRKETQSCKING